MKNAQKELILPQALAESAGELLAEGKNRLARKILHAYIDAAIPDETNNGASIAAEATSNYPRRRKPAAPPRHERKTENQKP